MKLMGVVFKLTSTYSGTLDTLKDQLTQCGPRAAAQARRDPRCSRAGGDLSQFCSALATRRAVAKCFGRS